MVSLVVGFAMALKKAERFLDTWIICLLTMPSLVLILTIYMIAGLNDRAAILGAAVPSFRSCRSTSGRGSRASTTSSSTWQGYHATRGQIIRLGHCAADCADHRRLGALRPWPGLEDGASSPNCSDAATHRLSPSNSTTRCSTWARCWHTRWPSCSSCCSSRSFCLD